MEQPPVNALLFCSDAQLLCTVDRAFSSYQVTADVCLSQTEVEGILQKKDFDLLALDLDEPGAAEVMTAWGARGPNSSKLVIAFARGTAKVPGNIHFMLPKPLTGSLLGKTLKAAQGMLVQKRRAGFRQSVNVKATVHVVENNTKYPLNKAMILDLSSGGVCMKTEPPVSKGSTIHIDFLIPGTSTAVHANGTVMWSEPTGVAGVRFDHIPQKERDKYKSWLGDAAMNSTVKLAGANMIKQ